MDDVKVAIGREIEAALDLFTVLGRVLRGERGAKRSFYVPGLLHSAATL